VEAPKGADRPKINEQAQDGATLDAKIDIVDGSVHPDSVRHTLNTLELTYQLYSNKETKTFS